MHAYLNMIQNKLTTTDTYTTCATQRAHTCTHAYLNMIQNKLSNHNSFDSGESQ